MSSLHNNPHAKFIRERRMSFMKAENEARKNPDYNPAEAAIIDKSTLCGWGVHEVKALYAESGISEQEANEANNGNV